MGQQGGQGNLGHDQGKAGLQQVLQKLAGVPVGKNAVVYNVQEEDEKVFATVTINCLNKPVTITGKSLKKDQQDARKMAVKSAAEAATKSMMARLSNSEQQTGQTKGSPGGGAPNSVTAENAKQKLNEG